ncbi:MAG: metallophosphoesterase [Promethearchaeota archaeon]
MKTLEKKNDIIWQIAWIALLLVISTTLPLAIVNIYNKFSTSFQGVLAPIVPILIIFAFAVSAAGISAVVKRIMTIKNKGRKTKEKFMKKIPDMTRPGWTIGWSIWFLMVGLALIGACAYLFDQFSDEITDEYLTIATLLGVSLIALGTAFVLSSLKVFISLPKRKKTRIAPGITSMGIAFTLLIPTIGIYYYVGIYLPEQKYMSAMDRGPFLFWNDDTSSTMVIAWDSKLTENQSFSVKWGESSSNLNSTTTPISYQIFAPSSGTWESGTPIGYRYYVKLSGLSPNKTYYYTVPNFINKVYSFTTGPSTTKPFSFQVIGDTRRPDTMHSRLVTMMLNDYDADFIINVGDVCNNGLLDWNQFFDEIRYQANERPYLVAVGNHEYGNEFGYYFNYEFTPNHYYYSLNYSNVHMLFIDNFDGSNDNVSAQQKLFIEEDLQRNAGKHDWTIAAFHVPIFSTGDFNYDPAREADLMPLFTQYGVDIVLTGHDHHYESFNISRSILESKFGTYNSTGNGMMHFVSGGGGSPLDIPQCMGRDVDPWQELYHNASNPATNWQKYLPKGATAGTAEYTTSDIQIYAELVWQFMQIDVNGPNMNITSIRLDGTTIERFELTK